MNDDELAEWGQVPFDLYMLEKWDPSSTEDDEDQRIRLANEYVRMGAAHRAVYHEAIRKEHYPTVTQSQIDTILSPLQTVQERNLHLDSCDKIIWLRTCYQPGSDILHEQLLSSLPYSIDEATDGEGEECLLDDQNLYDYGDDWTRIFRRLPELVKGDHTPFNDQPKIIRDAQINAVRAFEKEKLKEPDSSFVHIMCASSHLFIKDAEALRTGSLLVVWLDDCGRVVRQGRCPADELTDISALETKGAVYDCFEPWMTGEIGEAYRDSRLPYNLDPPMLSTFGGLQV